VSGNKLVTRQYGLINQNAALDEPNEEQEASKNSQPKISNFHSVPEDGPVFGSFIGSLLALVVASCGAAYAGISAASGHPYKGLCAIVLSGVAALSGTVGLLIGLDPYSLLMRL